MEPHEEPTRLDELEVEVELIEAQINKWQMTVNRIKAVTASWKHFKLPCVPMEITLEDAEDEVVGKQERLAQAQEAVQRERDIQARLADCGIDDTPKPEGIK